MSYVYFPEMKVVRDLKLNMKPNGFLQLGYKPVLYSTHCNRAGWLDIIRQQNKT